MGTNYEMCFCVRKDGKTNINHFLKAIEENGWKENRVFECGWAFGPSYFSEFVLDDNLRILFEVYTHFSGGIKRSISRLEQGESVQLENLFKILLALDLGDNIDLLVIDFVTLESAEWEQAGIKEKTCDYINSIIAVNIVRV